MYGYPQQQPMQPMYGGQPGFQQPGFQQPGFQQPMMMQQPVMRPQQQGPTIINITKKEGGTKCPFCGETTESRPRKSAGCVTWCWCIFLGPLFFVPFCVDGCKDTELVCEKCG
jgi:hypothetical protein